MVLRKIIAAGFLSVATLFSLSISSIASAVTVGTQLLHLMVDRNKSLMVLEYQQRQKVGT